MQIHQIIESTGRNPSEYMRALNPVLNGRRVPIEDPEVTSNSRILVLAPHQDDPIMGCGGTMCKLAKRGAHVKVLFMTNTSYEDYVDPACNLILMEEGEAEETMEMLLCFESEHLGLPVMGIQCEPGTKRRLRRAIEYYSPDIIFLPSIQDMHPDNTMTGLLAANALREYGSCLTLYSYEVWGGLYPNTKVEISEVMEEKLQAIRVRNRQRKDSREDVAIWEKVPRNPAIKDEGTYCEPFVRQELEDFIEMSEKLGVYNFSR